MRGGLIRYLKYISFQSIGLSVHLSLQLILHILDRTVEGISVFSAVVLQKV